MEIASKDYIINTVFRTNILPVISKCNTACVFCSHRQNPVEVEVFRMPELTLEDYKEIAGYLSPDKKIVIGESATRIIEGEPLLYGDILELLSFIRSRYPFTPIQITTNGILLNGRLIESLSFLGNIELNVSVNAVQQEMRKYIHGVADKVPILDKLKLLKDKIKFSCSFVYLPEIMDKESIEDMVKGLEAAGAESVRLFLPGYTNLSRQVSTGSALAPDCKTSVQGGKASIQDSNTSARDGKASLPIYITSIEEMYKTVSHILESLCELYSIPVIIEPAVIDNLECKIEGVIAKSYAFESGLKAGDIIISVNKNAVRSRVDGFNKVFASRDPELEVIREGAVLGIKLQKPAKASPGFIVHYDIDVELANDFDRAVKRNKADNVLLLSSKLGYGVIRCLLETNKPQWKYELRIVDNSYFGGTVACAGLLTCQDVENAAREAVNNGFEPDLILVPPIMFDNRKRDLLGVHMNELEGKLGIRVDHI